MNIMMMTNTFTPHIGGVARSVETFTAAYRRQGHSVMVVAPEFDKMDEDEMDVVRIPAIQNFNGSDFSVVLPIHGLLSLPVERFRPDIIHAHHPFLLCGTALRMARRYDLPLSVLFIETDGFKSINDTHGHLEGDKVLVDFSGKAKTALRETDRLTRFGGDEFMAILPDTDAEHATLTADRLHQAGKSGQPIAWSVSIGISEWRGPDDSLAALQTRADRALYKAKAQGRSPTQSI